jgi:hypothetical protein
MVSILTNLRLAASEMTIDELSRQAGVDTKSIRVYEDSDAGLSEEDLDKISKVLSTRLKIAYIAGLFDRRSSWTVLRLRPAARFLKDDGNNTGPVNFTNYSSRIRFVTKHKLLAEVLEAYFGAGFVSRSECHGCTRYEFFVTNRRAQEVAEKLLPHLILKKQQAEIIIKVSEIMRSANRNSKAVVATNIKYGTSYIYPSTLEASKTLHIPLNRISSCLIGRQKTTIVGKHWYKFEYAPKVTDLNNTIKEIELENLYNQLKQIKL